MAITLTGKLAPEAVQPGCDRPVLTLPLRDRQRSRLAAMLPEGRAVAVLLARGESMQHGDVLCNEAGDQVLIQAAVEELLEIRADTPFALMRIVYHLANRHVRAMLTPETVLIEPDSVLAAMVVRLGGKVRAVSQAFHPEGGAYSGGQGGHHHHHGHEAESLEDAAKGNLGEELSIAAHARG